MKRKFLVIMLMVCNACFSQANDPDPNMGIIPAPVSVEKTTGHFTFNNTVIITEDTNDRAANFLVKYLADKGIKTRLITGTASKGSAIILSSKGKGADTLQKEGYRLTITPQSITITGKDAGLFYGIQTLIQLLPDERSSSAKIPGMVINDHPRFFTGDFCWMSRGIFLPFRK